MELFEQEAGVKMTRVVYQGVAPATTDLLAGRVQIIALTPTAVVPHMQSGRLRLLAITQATRNPLFPDLPTIAELGYPAATVSVWYAMSGPKGLPEDIRKTLEKAMAGVAGRSAGEDVHERTRPVAGAALRRRAARRGVQGARAVAADRAQEQHQGRMTIDPAPP